MTPAQWLAQVALAALVLVCYTVLTALGHDAEQLLGVLAGQLAAIGAHAVAQKVTAP